MQNINLKFEKELFKILDNLNPHRRICKWSGINKYCEKEFKITNEDITFLKKLKVPPPNFCLSCRRIQRYANINILKLSKINCQAPNHNEKIISIFPENCPFPVFDYKFFISDEFDAFIYGKDFNIETYLEDFFEIRKKFPLPSFLNRDPLSVNSEYSNGGRDTKNAYYAGGCFHSENVWYSSLVNKSKFVMDSRDINNCDTIYNCSRLDNSYKCSYVYNSSDCTDSMFLYDCRNCTDCIGCVGLRNVSNYIFNKKYSRDDYEKIKKELYPLTREKIRELNKKLEELMKTQPINASLNRNVENVKGILNENSKNLFDCTICENSSDMRYCDGCLSHSDSMDVLFSGGKSNNLYMSVNVGSQSSNIKFSVYNKFCTNSEFIFNCKNIDNCFMCFGLQNKSYCILNKQYSKEDYFEIVDNIKFDMLQKGIYGDFINPDFCAVPYNFSHAQISFPQDMQSILNLGYYFSSDPETTLQDQEVLTYSTLPQVIDEINDDILNKVILCTLTNKPFRVTDSELEFLRKMKISLPDTHPSIRLENLFKMAPMGIYYNEKCIKCGINIDSFYSNEKGYNLYCTKCYQAEVY